MIQRFRQLWQQGKDVIQYAHGFCRWRIRTVEGLVKLCQLGATGCCQGGQNTTGRKQSLGLAGSQGVAGNLQARG